MLKWSNKPCGDGHLGLIICYHKFNRNCRFIWACIAHLVTHITVYVQSSLDFFYSFHQHAHRFFHLRVHVPFYLHFWGYIQIFVGAMHPLTLHWGYKENELHFLHARSCILYSSCLRHWIVPLVQSWRKLFFLSDRNWSSVCLFCLSHHFFVILYITCHILFLYRTECKITYSHDH